MRKSKNLIFAICLIACIVLLACMGTSLSKFLFRDDDNITGGYTAFVLAHNADGQSAVLQSDGSGSYVGYVDVQVFNYTAEQTSARDVEFTLRAPEADEIQNGSVDDGWGNKIDLEQENTDYLAELVSGASYKLTGGAKNSVSLVLKITHSGAVSGDFNDKVSIIIETSSPYIVRQVFTVSVTNSLVSFGISSEDYFNFDGRKVTVKTSADFSSQSGANGYTTQLGFTLSGNIMFDSARFASDYPASGVKAELNGTTLKISGIAPAAEIDLHFYLTGAATLTVTVTIDDTPYEKVSGLGAIDGNGVYTVITQ